MMNSLMNVELESDVGLVEHLQHLDFDNQPWLINVLMRLSVIFNLLASLPWATLDVDGSSICLEWLLDHVSEIDLHLDVELQLVSLLQLLASWLLHMERFFITYNACFDLHLSRVFGFIEGHAYCNFNTICLVV
jgi:hypothetical protein